eukprot:TRINITY_DN7972_c0_g1_i1.p1 TRINITY_DN7972_c0_g1~~TRINITY_DN7972_c0_g1_i1.p1  ORF type:complete len:131 (-),score=2.97 TRINITY_DN7972_c0_g1_i1:92-484(-)
MSGSDEAPVKRVPSVTRDEVHGDTVCESCGLATAVAHVPMCCPKTMRGVLKKGERYLWCSCGRSSETPLCDGKECGEFVPVPFTVNVTQSRFSVCACAYTRTPPLCDGTHATMPATPTVCPCKCDRDLEW